MRPVAFVLALLTLGGCQLYFGGDDDPPPCYGDDIGYDDSYQSINLRDPATGVCQEFGGGWGGGCDACGNCYGAAEDKATPPTPPIPNWPQCESACSNLDEATCIDEPGCQAAYWEETPLADAPSVTTFRGCYATVGGPDIYSSCWNLDAYACAQFDNCSLFYAGVSDVPEDAYGSRFSRCAPEATQRGCETVDCGIGYHCEDTCYPLPDDPNCGPNGTADCAGEQCTPMCVPDQGTGCAAIDCGPGYECVETCETTEPSTAGGCFPGQCYGTCVPTTACETLPDQQACDARSDCTSVFSGDDCTCYPGGYCECEILTWDHCESLGGVPMPL